jgi:exopolysaccharide production protein ExoY
MVRPRVAGWGMAEGRIAEQSRAGPRLDFGVALADEIGVRLLDIGVALCLILMVAPLLLAVAVCVKVQDGGPVIFAHERLGRGGRKFRCLKFRSMAPDAESRLRDYLGRDPIARDEWARNHKLRTDPRVTPLGAYLRRYSLDELPQLWNVLVGDMSVVGPRPIVDDEIQRYGRRYRYYCSVKPGMTGLWQVSGRSAVSYRRRVAMDTVYAQRKSLVWDVRLLVLTVPAVLLGRGS